MRYHRDVIVNKLQFNTIYTNTIMCFEDEINANKNTIRLGLAIKYSRLYLEFVVGGGLAGDQLDEHHEADQQCQ